MLCLPKPSSIVVDMPRRVDIAGRVEIMPNEFRPYLNKVLNRHELAFPFYEVLQYIICRSQIPDIYKLFPFVHLFLYSLLFASRHYGHA